jgi:hypothetical protein
MFVLVALLTNTVLGDFNTKNQCENAIRQVYQQRLDPYNTLPRDVLKEVLEFNMKYDAPRKYVCLEK